MAEIDNPDAPVGSPRTGAFAGRESKAHRDRGTPSAPARLIQFVRDVRAEMKRVSWPNAKTVKNTTIITVIAVIFFAIYLFLVDQVMTWLVWGVDWLITKLAGLLGFV